MPVSTTARPRSVWLLTDGKAGDLAQCTGVAEALGVPFEIRTVSPKPPFSWWLPFGPTDFREWENRPDSPLRPPYPDLVIASGRRAAAYLRRIKRKSHGRVFTVFLKDPRTGPGAADMIWVPEHDALRGSNVLVTVTAPHRYQTPKLSELAAEPVPALDRLPQPRVAVLAGGNSRHHMFTDADEDAFLSGLKTLVADKGAGLMITASRRTPDRLSTGLQELAAANGHFFWAGGPDNPFGHMLAKADAIVATADSTNMIGEAAATGKPIHVFHPSGGHRKITQFLNRLEAMGAAHPFPGPLKTTTYEPIDATPEIAKAILTAYASRQQQDKDGAPR
ncbi:nucleoside-diphosphate sugar epimerase [Roseibium denhamense]|uniref:Nucleoside-diphosphate sugar epimerase n=1 Tax=Roseibium denhamense TaxID=76305 RepID=A0ABY1NEC4_9HYPH|nr:mitochondrial fission ELM1 family protein [Roseibium denhamense]MTI04165.1 nucleoside-diphosphate sugar epimerase [Roseibium denhamense]SMP07320.1 hypothetical protein SAMN06265374_0859 [Roseibium denhamense]